jgi:hypothetical protein
MFINGKCVARHLYYGSVDSFLDDMRNGKLIEGFSMTEETFLELITMINMDANLAKEIYDQGMLLMLSQDGMSQMGGLVAIAEACCG